MSNNKLKSYYPLLKFHSIHNFTIISRRSKGDFNLLYSAQMRTRFHTYQNDESKAIAYNDFLFTTTGISANHVSIDIAILFISINNISNVKQANIHIVCSNNLFHII